MTLVEIVAESEYRLVIPRYGRMRVPGVVFATRALIPDPAADRALEQVGQRRGTARDRGGVVCDARCALGVRVPDRRSRHDRRRPGRGHLPGRGTAAGPRPGHGPAGRGGGLWDLHGRAELDKLLAGGAAYAVACRDSRRAAAPGL